MSPPIRSRRAALPLAAALALAAGLSACGHSTMEGVRTTAFYENTIEHKGELKPAYAAITEQMRRCYRPYKHFAGTNHNRIDARIDDAGKKAEIAFYNDGAAYRGYVSVVTLEAIPSGTKISTHSQAKMWQFVHNAIPRWLEGDREVCPDHFLLGVGATYTPVYVPVVVRRR